MQYTNTLSAFIKLAHFSMVTTLEAWCSEI